MWSSSGPAVISLGLTKSGKRQGALEIVTLTERPVLLWLWEWKKANPPHTFLTDKPHVWRQMFNDCLQGVRLQEWEFKPYSLRRGGATFYFAKIKMGSLDRILLMGRRTAVKTAKIYINTGLSMLTELRIQLDVRFTLFFKIIAPNLEPARKPSRPGGRGKTMKSPQKRGKSRKKKKEKKEGSVRRIFF